VGLAPIMVNRMIAKIKELKERRNLTVLMAEQNFNQAIKIADRGYIIVHGEIAFEGRSAAELKNNELVKQYYGKPVNFELHLNSELGLEKDYFAYMSQGISVDYAVVAPSHMSTFSPMAPLRAR